MKFKNIFLNFFGIFYILISLLAFYNAIKYFSPQAILWISYFTFLILGIGILFRSSYLIGSQINIIFFPYIIWDIDFIYRLITSKSLLGITDYVFQQIPYTSLFVTIQHIIILPIAFISLYFIKFKENNFWIFSFFEISLIFIFTRILSDPSKNINCVFKNCLPFDIALDYYPFIWLGFYIFMILIVNLFLIKIKLFKG